MIESFLVVIAFIELCRRRRVVLLRRSASRPETFGLCLAVIDARRDRLVRRPGLILIEA